MKLAFPSGTPLHLTYCLNIHPGETWEENFTAIRTHALAVRDRVASGRRFGLGLRLGARAAAELDNPPALAAFRRFLDRENLYVFTVNGFPYGRFHGAPVKENVYAPDWRTPERLGYTLSLGRILAALLPRGVRGSISTVPGSYRSWIGSAAAETEVLAGVARAAAGLAAIRRQTGRTVVLALEPEPDCLWQRTDELLALWRRLRDPEQLAALAHHCGIRVPTLRAALERHLGVCVDTCHASVQFERPADVLRQLQVAGIPVAKVQISAAPACHVSPATLNELAVLQEPVYLHQTRLRGSDASVASFSDLAPALAAASSAGPACELRTHFHIPLSVERFGSLGSTRAELDAPFFALLRAGAAPHVELETYTFQVLPEELRRQGVEASLEAEFRWIFSRLSPE